MADQPIRHADYVRHGDHVADTPECWDKCGDPAAQDADTERWIKRPDGTRQTFTGWGDWVDALFSLGITVPGAEGIMTNEDGTTTEWGTLIDGGGSGE